MDVTPEQQFASLANALRLGALRILLDGRARPVRSLARDLAISDSLCSRHLKNLGQVNLLRTFKSGRVRYYVVDRDNVANLVGVLGASR
jgi:DNA-binding transcriptional ArsR family regulator